MIDPYQILGISKNASMDDIKKSYRKLARKFHPDLNPGNKDSEKKFKEISRAFDLIGTKENKEKFDNGETDEQKQYQYDQYRRNNANRDNAQFHRYTNSFRDDFDADDLFSSLFGKTRKQNQTRYEDTSIQGEDVLYQMEIDFVEAALGGDKVITLPNGKKLQVKIPAGIAAGTKLKFKGLGSPPAGPGPAGDAYIQISIKSLQGFERFDNDIHSEVPISFFEAVLGAEIEIPTIDGSVMLKIPAGASSGTKLRIKNKGVGNKDNRGHQIVTLKIVMPKHITSDLREAMASLQNKFSYNPRAST